MFKLLTPVLMSILSTHALADDTPNGNMSDGQSNNNVEAQHACKVVIESDDGMQYNTDHFAIDKKACPQFTIELVHVGKLPRTAMGHNIVISKSEDMESITNDGLSAGIDSSYLQPDDPRVIAHTNIIGGGEKTSVTFDTKTLQPGGDYLFFCSYPSHHTIMQGKVSVE